MMGRTHIAIGLTVTVGAGYLLHFDLPQYAVACLFSLSGSLLPDIDHEGSIAGQVCPPLAIAIRRKFGHRGITHSVLALLTLTLLTIPMGGLYGAVGLFIGYLGHMLADMLTPSGIELLYPNKKRIGIGLIATGSSGEEAVVGLLFAAVLLMIFK